MNAFRKRKAFFFIIYLLVKINMYIFALTKSRIEVHNKESRSGSSVG